MLGPYTANKDGTIDYQGNKLFRARQNILAEVVPTSEFEARVKQLREDGMWGSIARINHRINLSANAFFDEQGALFTALPLTTRMISSPGAVYGKEAIDYTTDTCPLTLSWFDHQDVAFLAESAQIYLEIALMQERVDHVYSVYNSFRKEEADATHLSEFHHIEYEGKVDQETNNRIALGLIGRIITDLVNRNEADLARFLSERKITEVTNLANGIQDIPKITFREALDALHRETGKDQYKRFTLDQNFGSWEEVLLTQIYGSMVAVSRLPLLEVPFYHARKDGFSEANAGKNGDKDSLVADNTDFIWPGYRETIGSGHRVRSISELEEKARIFNLPPLDYAPYLQTRELANYVPTSGFGLGWERLLQGLLEMPFIWSAAQFPRGHTTLRP